jgi:predicted Rossmann fold nucleotide-binding protein DprA/Smf involved in DNA uptake
MIDISQETLIPVLETKKLVPISTPTIRRLTASGRLETVRVGAKVFTSKEAVARMLQHGPQPSHQSTRQVSHRANSEALAASEWLRKRFSRFSRDAKKAA